MFDKPYDGTWNVFPAWFNIELSDGDLKHAWRQAFNKLDKVSIAELERIPNWSYSIFEEITGISEDELKEKAKDSKKEDCHA